MAENTRPLAEASDSQERREGGVLRPGQEWRLSETRRREANKARLATVPRAEARNIDLQVRVNIWQECDVVGFN